MLFDEIVERVDDLAYARHTNRSQLINDILADYLGVETPEQKIQSVLVSVGDNLGDRPLVSQISQNNSIRFGKSLKYKYRPKVRYVYEFKNNADGRYAVLKISSRTTNADLNEMFRDFFNHIGVIEIRHHQIDRGSGDTDTHHKFVRAFKHAGSVNRDEQGLTDFLTRYLRMIDSAMDTYFEDFGSADMDAELDAIYSYFLGDMPKMLPNGQDESQNQTTAFTDKIDRR